MSDTWSGQSQIDEVLANVRSTMKKKLFQTTKKQLIDLVFM